MAYTKIKPIHNHLQRCLEYTTNPEKTETNGLQAALHYTQNSEKTEQQVYVSAFHCSAENAGEKMQQTKARWGKDGDNHVLGYHVIQSFSPGEVTPEQAHQIGCEFVRRVLPNYEVTVSTHLDRAHLHNHIVFNSVSFVSGKMYRDDFRSYYQGIRGQSDALCKEYGLSIIQPERKGKAYNEYRAEQQGKPTMRSLIRQDVDRAIENAITWETFVINLKHSGYQIRYGPKIKYATIRHAEGKRAVRLKSLGPGYSEAELRQKIQHRQQPFHYTPRPQFKPRKAHFRFRGTFPAKHKYTGFMALYLHYVCLFRRARTGRTSVRTHYLLREDLVKFDRYTQQAAFIWEHQLESTDDVVQYQTTAQQKIEALTSQRSVLYHQRKPLPDGPDRIDLTTQIQTINEEIRLLRRNLRLCEHITEDADHLKQQLVQAQQQERLDQQREQQKSRQQGRWGRGDRQK